MMKKPFEQRTADDLLSALEICLKLRDEGFWSFRGQRDSGWHLGLHGDDRLDRIDMYIDEFRRRCKEFPPPHYIDERETWRWLFFAQHHRLKTRLLDWTKDPLVAIYFAVENILSRRANGSHPGVIWALHVHPRHFKREHELQAIHKEKQWIMINPPPVTARLARQSGLFTFHPGPDCRKPLDTTRRRPSERLIRIEFAPASRRLADSIREHLGILNIHHGSLFPDPEGIAEFVNHEWPFIALEEPLKLPTGAPTARRPKTAKKGSHHPPAGAGGRARERRGSRARLG